MKQLKINCTILYNPITQNIEDGIFIMHLTDVKHRYHFYPEIVDFNLIKEISRGQYVYEMIINVNDLGLQWFFREKEFRPLKITNITIRDTKYFEYENNNQGEHDKDLLLKRLKSDYRGYVNSVKKQKN